MQVLHVAEVLKGGTSSYLEEVLPYQASQFGAANVRVLIPESQRSDLPSSDNLPTTVFDDSGSRPDHILKLMKSIRQLVSERRPDVVHAHGTFAGVAVRLALRLMRNPPPVIYCSHGWAFDREGAAWKNNAIALIERMLAPFAKKIICISEHDRRSALRRGFSKNKLVVVLNGIRDVPSARIDTVSWPDGKRRILFAGRFDRQKGIDIFIEAMQKLGDEYFAYAIGASSVGDTTLPSVLPHNVKLTGWLTRTQVQEHLASAEIFVMPSRWEGFGLSALEAMRAGLPVIASKVGGLPELIEDQVTGLLIEPNSVDALVLAIQSVEQNRAATMGAASRGRFERDFQSDLMNQQIIRTYTESPDLS